MATILLVDDSPYTLDVMEQVLALRGHVVLQASDGASALEMLRRQWPDLVIQDLVLPDVNGLELLRYIRELPRGPELPVVAISAMRTRLKEAAEKETSFNAYIEKPFEPQDLLKLVDEMVRSVPTTVCPVEQPAAVDTVDGLRALVTRLSQFNSQLSDRLTALTDNYRLMASLLDTLSQASDLTAVVEKGMRGCMDAARARRGMLYLLESGNTLRFRCAIGCTGEERLANFFGRFDKVERALENNETIVLKDDRVTADDSSVALLVPLTLPHPVGVIVFVLARDEVDDERCLSVRAVASQLGQSISLAHALARKAESERTTRLLLESTAEGIYGLDLDGRCTFINPAGARMLGLEIEEARGSVLRHDAAPTACNETTLQRKDGTSFPAEISSHPVIEEGRQTGTVVVFRDITARHQVEEALRDSEAQLRQTQKMDAIGKLAAGVAHDFNNLLTATSGYAEMLLRDLPPDDSKREFVQEIALAAEHGTSLTRQLLSFSRRQMVMFHELSINRVITNVECMLRRLLGEDVRLITALNVDVGPVRSDAGQLEQVILNLAINAREAMPQGGELQIGTSRVHLDEQFVRQYPAMTAGPYVLLSVQDTGCGMDAQTQAHIFEPFFTTKEGDTGSGMGLSTVYGIVAQNGGCITVSSAPEKGTIFKIYLPAVQETSRTVSADEGEKSAVHATILLVEDEASVRRMTAAILRRHGYTVLEASNAREALHLCDDKAGAVDLLLTDVVMPDVNGRVLAEQIRQLIPRVRVIYMSGYTDDATLRYGVSVDRIPFLQKPFRADLLMQKVQDVLNAPPSPEEDS